MPSILCRLKHVLTKISIISKFYLLSNYGDDHHINWSHPLFQMCQIVLLLYWLRISCLKVVKIWQTYGYCLIKCFLFLKRNGKKKTLCKKKKKRSNNHEAQYFLSPIISRCAYVFNWIYFLWVLGAHVSSMETKC